MEEKKRIPKEAQGLCWGGFLMSLIWGPFNGVWSSLLVLVPVVNIVMPFVLLFKGREWAWQNSHWDSVEHFNKVQKRWTIAGLIPLVLSVVSVFYAIPNFKKYGAKAKRAEAKILLIQAYSELEMAKAETNSYPIGWSGLSEAQDDFKPRYRLATVDTEPLLEKYCPDCQVNEQNYKVAAIGNIDDDSGLDIMVIDEKRQMKLILDDLKD